MKEEFKKNLIKYIKEKTGYLEELEVANIFSKAGWGIRHSNYYLDKDEEKGREIDIFAYKSELIKNDNPKKKHIYSYKSCLRSKEN